MGPEASPVSPFQGSSWGGRPSPGALPRADLFRPLRGEDSTTASPSPVVLSEESRHDPDSDPAPPSSGG